MIDATDATFATDVVERSNQVPVVVDLWAPWCGPCKQLGPILERVIAETGGKVELAKVNVDENPMIAQQFKVQGIPAVYAVAGAQVVDGFVGAQGEDEVRAFVSGLLPTEAETEIDRLVRQGDEASLRQVLELEPGHEGATIALAEVLVSTGRPDEALELLEKIPDTAEARRIAALARHGDQAEGDIEARLDALLGRVKDDDEARQEFIDLLEVLGADDPRTAHYRKQLTSRLF